MGKIIGGIGPSRKETQAQIDHHRQHRRGLRIVRGNPDPEDGTDHAHWWLQINTPWKLRTRRTIDYVHPLTKRRNIR